MEVNEYEERVPETSVNECQLSFQGGTDKVC